MNLCIGVARFLDFEITEFGQFGVELGLQANFQFLQEVGAAAAFLAILTSI